MLLARRLPASPPILGLMLRGRAANRQAGGAAASPRAELNECLCHRTSDCGVTVY